MTAAALLGDTFLYTVLPVSAAKLGLDALAVGLVLSLNRWVRLVTNVAAARLYGRFAAGALVLVALGLAVVSTAAYALPTALVLFLGARLVWGMTWSLLRLGSLLAAIESARGRAGRALGEVRAVYGLGYFGGALYAPLAVEAMGWEGAALVAAALTLVLGVGPALLVRPWRRRAALDEREEAAVRNELFDPRFVGLFLVAAVQYALYAGVVAIGGGLRIGELFAGGAVVAGAAAAATFVAAAFALAQRLAQVAWPPLAGRFADRSLPATFLASTLVAAVATLALAAVSDATLFVVLGAVAFFSGITSIVALELAIAHRTTTSDRPRVLGAYNTWADAGAAAGALGVGLLALAGTALPFVVSATLAITTLTALPTVASRAARVGVAA